jgi:hypothetical protein
MQILRKIFGPVNIDNIWRTRNNMEIDKLIEGADIVRLIEGADIVRLIEGADIVRLIEGADIVRRLVEGADIVRFIKAQRIEWLGHIQRMDQARPTRKLLDWKPMGTRPVGRPRQRWQEDVTEDFKKLKAKKWKETAKERRTWRDLAEKAKTHKGL